MANPNRPLAARGRRELWLALGLAPLLSLLFFHFMLRDMPFFRDLYQEFYPMKVFLAEHLRRGQVPLWNPTEFMGMPFVAELATACFYPGNVLFLLLSPVEGFRYQILLHYPLAGLGLYFFLRDLRLRPAAAAVGAMSFAFSGYLVAQHANLIYLISPCYFPWALLCFRRALIQASLAWSLAAGLSVALPFLAGEPQGAAIAAIIGPAFAIYSIWGAGWGADWGAGAPTRAFGLLKSISLLATALLFAAGLSMIQFLPAWELSRFSERAQGMPLDEVTCWSFYPLRLLELFWPNLWGLPWAKTGYWGGFMTDWCFSMPWTLGLYLGLWPLLAVIFAFLRSAAAGVTGFKPVSRFFAALGVLALLLAFGRYAPFYKIAYDIVPGLRWFRYPEKYLALLSLAIAVLAGIGTHRFLEDPPVSAGFRRALMIGLGALVGVALFAWLGRGWMEAELAVFLQGRGFGHLDPAQAAQALLLAMTRSAAVAAGLLAILAFGSKRLPVLLALATGLDLYSANRPLVDTAPRWIYTGPSRAAELILHRQPGLPEKFRVFCDHSLEHYRGPFPPGELPAHVRQRLWHKDTLRSNWTQAFGLEEITGYSPAHPAWIYTLWDQNPSAAVLEAFNVKYALATPDWNALDDFAGVRTLDADPVNHFRLLLLEDYLPRAYVVTRARAEASEAEAAAALKQTDFRREAVLLTADPLPPETGDPAFTPARIISYEADRVELEVDPKQPGWLVLSDTYFPGWQARVNDQPAKIYRANYLVRAVAVGAGPSRVVFDYRPESYRRGRAITCLTLGISLAALVLAGSRRRRKART